MIEIITIVCSLITFLAFSTFPIKILNFESKNSYFEITLYDTLFFNFIINLLILFLLSFTKVNLSYYFIFILASSILINSYFILEDKNYKKIFRDNKFLILIFFNLVIFFYLASNPTLSWDGQQNWFFKAQSFYLNNNFFDLSSIKGPNYYPHFGSLIWGFFWKNSILQLEYSGRLVFIYLFLLSIFSVVNLLKVKDEIKILFIAIIAILCFDDLLIRGYQEILIFSLLIFISKNIFYFFNNQKNYYLIICFICINLLPWIKNEGYIFLMVFNLSLLFFIKSIDHKYKILVFVFLSTILLIIKNLIFYRYLGVNLTHGGELSLLISLNDFLEYFLSMILGVFVVFFKYKIWFFMFLSLYLIYFKYKKINNIFIKFLIINLTLYFIFIFVIYYSFSTHSYGIDWWIDNSLDRILFQVSGFFIILILIVYDQIKFKS